MDPRQPLPLELRQALDRALVAGEHVLWSAQPSGSRMWSAFAIWLFAIPWTVFSLFWEAAALSPWLMGENAPAGLKYSIGIVFPIFGVPFVLIGFAMLYMPIHAMQKARSTVYALTTRRLIKLVTGRASEMKSAFVDRIGPIERKEGAGGWGTLRIETHSRIDSDGDRITEKFEMFGIPDVARLERLIVEQQRRD